MFFGYPIMGSCWPSMRPACAKAKGLPIAIPAIEGSNGSAAENPLLSSSMPPLTTNASLRPEKETRTPPCWTPDDLPSNSRRSSKAVARAATTVLVAFNNCPEGS